MIRPGTHNHIWHLQEWFGFAVMGDFQIGRNITSVNQLMENKVVFLVELIESFGRMTSCLKHQALYIFAGAEMGES